MSARASCGPTATAAAGTSATASAFSAAAVTVRSAGVTTVKIAGITTVRNAGVTTVRNAAVTMMISAAITTKAVPAIGPQHFLAVFCSCPVLMLAAVHVAVALPPGWYHWSTFSLKHDVLEPLVPPVPVYQELLLSTGDRSNITQDIADRKTP